MKKLLILWICVALPLFFIACATTEESENEEGTEETIQQVETTATIELPNDGSTPVAGEKPVPNPTRTVTLKNYGDTVHVLTGQIVNFNYEGVDKAHSFLMYESTDDGYILKLTKENEPVEILFSRLCQTFIVSSPELTSIKMLPDIRYEQIIWTPRNDGAWEVRIGTTNRGCKSEALDRLNKLRNKDYEKQAKSTKMK